MAQHYYQSTKTISIDVPSNTIVDITICILVIIAAWNLFPIVADYLSR